jgi:MFS family permease
MTQWIGRKIPIMTGCAIMVVGSLVSCFSTNWQIYFAGRFILGFGNSFAQMCSPILLTEICHPQHRGVFSAVYNCLWNLGALFVAFIGWGTSTVPNEWSWRSITLLQGLPSAIQLCFIWWVPESPRWLISKERYEEAESTLAYYHGEGDRNNITVQFSYQEMKETIRMESDSNKNSSYIDFLKTKGNRWRLAILISLGIISQYSGNALFSNYINLVYKGAGIKSQNQSLGLAAGERVLALIVSTYAATLIDKVGRRPLFLGSTFGMVMMFVAWTITCATYENSGETNKAAGYAQIPFVWLFGVCYSFAWSGLLVAYALEILPYALRAKGLMIMNITVQAILAVGGQTNPVAWENLPKHWYLALFYTVSPHEHLANSRTLLTIISAGSPSNSSSCTSSTLRLRARLSRRSRVSSMATTLLPTSPWLLLKRKCTRSVSTTLTRRTSLVLSRLACKFSHRSQADSVLRGCRTL